jgi:hypothetical protein
LGDLVALIQYKLLREFALLDAGRLYRPNFVQPAMSKRVGGHRRYPPALRPDLRGSLATERIPNGMRLSA